MKGKRYIDAAKQVNNTAYEVKDAISLACELAKAKFDETMELHVKLGVDPKQADQQVRGVLVLPNGTGRSGYRKGRKSRRGCRCWCRFCRRRRNDCKNSKRRLVRFRRMYHNS